MNPKYNIKSNEKFGRFVVADQDLSAGEEILSETPFAIGPKVDSPLLCLGCYSFLDGTAPTQCSICSWPLCPDCPQASTHTSAECPIFKEAQIKFNYEADPGPQLESVVPLRVLLAMEKEPDRWSSEISTMEHHSSLRNSSPAWDAEGVNVVDFLRKRCHLENRFSEDLIRKVCGILEVNCFEVVGPPGTVPVRGLYYLTALLNHNCVANTTHSIDLSTQFKLTLRTTVSVSKGKELFSSYTDCLSPTLVRRTALKSSKYFDCACDRCQDPTELGTHLSSLKCPSCDNGLILPAKPLDETEPWKCNRCDKSLDIDLVKKLYAKMQTCVEYIQSLEDGPEKLEAAEKLYRSYRSSLHPHHGFLISLSHILINLYGRVDGYTLDMLPDILLERKSDLISTLLQILSIVEPGLTRTRARLLFELHAALLILSRSHYTSGCVPKDKIIQEMNKVAGILEESAEILRLEPVGSPEGNAGSAALASLAQLKESIKTLENEDD